VEAFAIGAIASRSADRRRCYPQPPRLARQERTAVAAEISTRECETSVFTPLKNRRSPTLSDAPSLPLRRSVRQGFSVSPEKNSAREKNLSVRPLAASRRNEIDFRDSRGLRASEPEFSLNCKHALAKTLEKRKFLPRDSRAHSLSLSRRSIPREILSSG
jgi:hypothetical protein